MKKYFLYDGNEQKGPFDLDELKAKNISSETPIWYDGIPDWTTANKVEELKEILKQSTPPPFEKKQNIPPPIKKHQHSFASTESFQNDKKKSSFKKRTKLLIIISSSVVVIAALVFIILFNQYNQKQELLEKEAIHQKELKEQEYKNKQELQQQKEKEEAEKKQIIEQDRKSVV